MREDFRCSMARPEDASSAHHRQAQPEDPGRGTSTGPRRLRAGLSMSHPGAKSVTRYRRRALLISLVAGLAGIAFLVGVHPFLATNSRVAADVLVVEGWVPAYVLDAAVRESRSSSYSHILVSGLEAEGGAVRGGDCRGASPDCWWCQRDESHRGLRCASELQPHVAHGPRNSRRHARPWHSAERRECDDARSPRPSVKVGISAHARTEDSCWRHYDPKERLRTRTLVGVVGRDQEDPQGFRRLVEGSALWVAVLKHGLGWTPALDLPTIDPGGLGGHGYPLPRTPVSRQLSLGLANAASCVVPGARRGQGVTAAHVHPRQGRGVCLVEALW